MLARPRERLIAQDPVVAEHQDRLERDLELRLVQERSQGACLRRCHHRQQLGDVVEHDDPPAAAALALVQRRVGLFPDHRRVVAGLRSERGDARREARRPRPLLRRGQHPLECRLRARPVGPGEHDRELVAADPERTVLGPPGAQHPSDLDQHLIAVAMALRVVGELEVVEIDERDGARVTLPGRERRRTPELLLERPVVPELGQRIQRGALDHAPVPARERTPTEHVDQPERQQQAEPEHPSGGGPHRGLLMLLRGGVGVDLQRERLPAQPQRLDELHHAPRLGRVRLLLLLAGVRPSLRQRSVDRRAVLSHPEQSGIGGDDHAAGAVDQPHRHHPWPGGQRLHHLRCFTQRALGCFGPGVRGLDRPRGRDRLRHRHDRHERAQERRGEPQLERPGTDAAPRPLNRPHTPVIGGASTELTRGCPWSGGGGIRTLGTVARTTVFETARFNHSRTPPRAATP